MQEMFIFLAGSSELVDIYKSVMNDGEIDETKLAELSESDTQKLRYVESAHQQRIDNLYYQYQQGFLDKEYWNMVSESLPYLAKRWQVMGIGSIRASFKLELERSRVEPETRAPF